MKPIKFKEVNVTYAEDQPEYIPLPVFKTTDGEVTTCWKLTFREKLSVLFYGKIWTKILTFNNQLYPMRIEANNPFKKESKL